MTARCANCGALLGAPKPGAYRIRCQYCGLDQEVHAPPPPAGSAPYPGAPASSPIAGIAVFAMIVLVIVGGVVPLLALRRAGRSGSPAISLGASGMAQAALAGIALDVTPEKLEAVTHVGADADYRMRVPLSGSRFDAVTFNWDKENLGHVSEIFLNCSGAQPEDETIRRKLHDLLGRRFEKSESFQWQDSHLYFSPSGGVLSIGVTIASGNDKNPHWKPQIEALWDVVREAIGIPLKVDVNKVRDYLGRGEPLGALAKLDPATDIDRSHNALARLFPGVTTRPFIDLDHTVAIDHPWYGEAQLSWKNKAGSRLATVDVRPPPGATKFPNQREIEACVESAFGKPYRRSDPDHLRGDWDTTWQPTGGGEIRVYQHMVAINVADNPFAKDMPRATWNKTLATLDRCGRR
jgi:hypothetical protein